MPRKKSTDIYPHVSYVCLVAARPIKSDSLSEEKRAELSAKMMKKVSENLSRYLSSHPEEIDSLI